VYGTPVAPPTGFFWPLRATKDGRCFLHWRLTFLRTEGMFQKNRKKRHSAFVRVPVLLLWGWEKNMYIPVDGATGVRYARRSADGILLATASD
jgi:hypothetical protein